MKKLDEAFKEVECVKMHVVEYYEDLKKEHQITMKKAKERAEKEEAD